MTWPLSAMYSTIASIVSLGVADLPQRPRDRQVDDLHRAAADELLELDQREVGLDARRVAVHHEADGAGRGEHRRLGVAVAVLLPELDDVVPRLRRELVDVGVHRVECLDVVVGSLVLAHDPLVGVGVAGVAGVRTDDSRELGRALVRSTGQQRRDGRRERTPALGVVAVTGRHEQGTEVGVADPQLAVVTRRLGDRLGREVREADRDVHRRDDELGHLLERHRVERVVVPEKLEQVQRRQVARAVVERHVLTARVGRRDPARLRVRVPGVDRVVVLQARVCALPRRLGDLLEQLPRVDLLDDLARQARPQAELAAVLDGLHELVRHADRVVRVLVLDRDDVLAAEIHVEAGVTQRADLVLLARLRLDELLDVGVVDVEDDHLRRATGRTARLDRSCRRIRTTHERHGTGGRATGREKLLGRADPRQVEARTRATLEDLPLFLVPVEDRVHRVVDGEDKARRHLLRRLCADVEPHRRVERKHLVQKGIRQLVLEDLGVLVRAEVPVLLPGSRVGQHHAVDELLEGLLAHIGAERTAEVLRRDDRAGVDRPEVGELHITLLEDRLAGPPVLLDDVAALPGHLVVGVHAGRGVDALDLDALLGAAPRTRAAVSDLRHAAASLTVTTVHVADPMS